MAAAAWQDSKLSFRHAPNAERKVFQYGARLGHLSGSEPALILSGLLHTAAGAVGGGRLLVGVKPGVGAGHDERWVVGSL